MIKMISLGIATFTVAVIVALSLVIMVSFDTGIMSFGTEGADRTYLLPNGFEGCVVVEYNVKGAETLNVKNNEVIYNVPESGIVETSTTYEEWWDNGGKGLHEVNAFYVGEDGEKIRELEEYEIQGGGSSSTTEDEKPTVYRDYESFGPAGIVYREQYARLGCSG